MERINVPPVAEDGQRSWSFSHAAIVGCAGFAGFFLSIFLLTNKGNRVYWLLSLSNVEAHSFDVIVKCLAAAIAGFVATRAVRRHSKLGFWGSIEWDQSATTLAALFGLGLAASCLMRFVLAGASSWRIANGVGVNRLFIFTVVGTVVLQPLTEEIYFRGILFSSLSSKMRPMLAMGLVTILFAFLHPRHQLVVLPISILLGAVRLFTKSTANCFALHAAYNLGVVLWGIR